jgi:acetyl esterase
VIAAPTPSPSEAATGPALTHAWKHTLWHRLRIAATTAFFESFAGLTSLHPLANPARSGVTVERDVVYGPDPRHHRLDLYRPAGRPKPWPVVFYVHGGAFHLLSKRTHWLMGLVFARHGYLVVNIDYRLAPAHPFPAPLEDVCTAYRWLAARIERLGGDPDRVAIAGESAGGNLITALALATTQRRTEPFARGVFDTGLVPRAALPFCAILEVSRPERFAARRPMPFWITAGIRDTARAYLHGHPVAPCAATELADPLCILESDRPTDRLLPPFFAPVGTRDPLLDDTRRLAAALARRDVPCEAQYYRGGIHAFHALIWDPVARRCWRDALAFLDRALRA